MARSASRFRGGELWLQPVDDEPALQQLHYRGSNVMLGYATGPADLARGDELQGVLVTGDLAERDSDGFFRLTGRLTRFAKLFGKRVNLASVETEIEKHFPVRAAALESNGGLQLFLEGGNAADGDRVRMHVANLLAVPPMALKASAIGRLPMTASGKKDYRALA